jgi:tetratricopeptide (TPR) repeat protein
VLFSLLGLAVIGAATVALVRRRKREAFWILWAMITLAPMLNIIPFRAMMNDRYMYLTLLGPLALLGSVLDSVSRRNARRVAGYAAGAAVVACVVLTARQVEHWSSPLSRWTNNATRLPLPVERGVSRINYAAQLAYLEAAVAEEPNNPTLHNNLGGLYYQTNRHQEAFEHFERANRLRPDEPFNLMNLGRAYAGLSRQEDAERALIRATELRPYNYLAWRYSLQFYLQTGDAAKARRAFDVCVQLRPDLPASALKRERTKLQKLEEQSVEGSTALDP